MNNAQGADVSLWDMAPIKYPEYRSRFPFAMIKVSEGLAKDPLFDGQWNAARGQNVRSPYHFFRSYVDQKRAVQKMLEYLGDDQGELSASLDLEVADGSTEIMVLTHTWVDEYHRLTGLLPIVYSTRNFLHENGSDYQGVWDRLRGVYRNAWLKDCSLWLAEWPFDELETLAGYTQRGDELRAVLIQEVIDGRRQLTWPKPIAPWTAVDWWQWTSRFPPGQIPGYFMGPNHKLAVDMNFHRLNRADFETAYPLQDAPPPEPPAPPEPEPEPEPEGANVKGTAKPGTNSNVKSMEGGSTPITVLTGGMFVYGSDSITDITNFNHYYTAAGLRVELGQMCKVTKGNLAIGYESEPTTPPPSPEPSGNMMTVTVSGVDDDGNPWSRTIDSNGAVT